MPQTTDLQVASSTRLPVHHCFSKVRPLSFDLIFNNAYLPTQMLQDFSKPSSKTKRF